MNASVVIPGPPPCGTCREQGLICSCEPTMLRGEIDEARRRLDEVEAHARILAGPRRVRVQIGERQVEWETPGPGLDDVFGEAIKAWRARLDEEEARLDAWEESIRRIAWPDREVPDGE